MKTTTMLSIATATILLTACGGGDTTPPAAGGDTSASTKLCIPADFGATTYLCKADCNSSEYEHNSYADITTCEEVGTQWIAEYTRNDTPFSQEQADAYTYVNNIRQSMGISPLKYDTRLETASKMHEFYIGDVYDTYNTVIGHYEDNSTYPSDYYTGVYPSSRAYFQGFSGSVWEVLKLELGSEATAQGSLLSLITGIYHRHTILNPTLYRVGNGGFDTGFTLKAEGHLYASEYDKISFLLYNAPEIATYPYDGQVDFQTTFPNNENPDPLPDISVSVGNPISVELNPDKVISPTMVSFKLFYDNNDTEITNTRVLTKDTDPNGYFTEYQFALFPLDVLDANTSYRAEFEYVDNGVDKVKVWRFRTRQD